MKKPIFFLVLIVFCMQVAFVALGTEIPETLISCDIPDTSFLSGAVFTEDGILLTGVPIGQVTPWISLFDKNGAQRWVFSEAAKNVSQYICPSQLDDGTYAVLRQSSRNDAGYDCDRLTLDANGKLLRETPLWSNTNWIIPREEETYTIGCYNDNGTLYPIIALQDSKGNDLFAYYYTVDGCTSAEFEKGLLTEDSLIVSGQGTDTQYDQSAGLLYKIDLEGKVVWGLTSTANNPNETVFSNDFCVTDEGRIIWIFTTVLGDEDDGYPIERSSTVYCLDMNGKTLWTYQTSDNRMLDYLVAVSGGILFGSRGSDLENCPYLGEGWLLYLNRDGQENSEMDLPQLGNGNMELLGMAENTINAVFCYGLLMQDPGYPSNPFFLELNLPIVEK